jgi:outer membrane immunogenic protein
VPRESLGYGGVMKRIFLGTVTAGALVMGGQAALGADVGVPTLFNPDVSVPTLFNYWNGAYLGLHGGWGWTTTRGLNASGDFGGGQAGYNYQIGNLVFGVEGDGAFANISQNITDLAIGIPGSFGYKDDGLASLRGRFGIAFNNLLFYGTAGGGWGHDRITALGVSAEAWHTGWSAGGGFEYGFLPNWAIKVEYLHYGLGSATYFGNLNPGTIDVETFKVGVNFLFR